MTSDLWWVLVVTIWVLGGAGAVIGLDQGKERPPIPVTLALACVWPMVLVGLLFEALEIYIDQHHREEVDEKDAKGSVPE